MTESYANPTTVPQIGELGAVASLLASGPMLVPDDALAMCNATVPPQEVVANAAAGVCPNAVVVDASLPAAAASSDSIGADHQEDVEPEAAQDSDGELLPEEYEAQWPRFDGNFIAPFIASDRVMIDAAVDLLNAAGGDATALACANDDEQRSRISALPCLCRGLDVVADLGCGDGRVIATIAARTGLTGLGIDLDTTLIDRAEARFGPSVPNVSFEVGDLTDTRTVEGIAQRATVVFLYQLPSALEFLEPSVTALCRRVKFVLSNKFPVPYLEPHRVAELTVRTSTAGATESLHVYAWNPAVAS